METWPQEGKSLTTEHFTNSLNRYMAQLESALAAQKCFMDTVMENGTSDSKTMSEYWSSEIDKIESQLADARMMFTRMLIGAGVVSAVDIE